MKTKQLKFWARSWHLAAGICFLTIGFSAGGTILHWYNIGPQPINSFDNKQNLIGEDCGRVAALAVDPSGSSHWLLGAAQGGIWETFNSGSSWIPRTDSQASMAMGAIAFAPGNPLLVYAGTGEPNFRGDDYAGAGLLLSQDGGSHWQLLNTNFARTSFSRIRVNPAVTTNLAVATVRGGAGIREESSGDVLLTGASQRGVFISTDGGTNFTRVLTGEATALEANPGNFGQQYAGLGEIYGDPTNGVYRTTNNWQTVELIRGPWIQTNVSYVYTNYPIATNVINGTNYIVYTNVITGTNITVSYPGGRIAMASSPSDPNTLYVGIASTRTRYIASLYGIWVTKNAWAPSPTWTQLSSPNVFSDGVSSPRFWYYFDLLVAPNNPDVLYLAEFDVWSYVSGTWTEISNWFPDHVHPDQHVMTSVPGGGQTFQILLGNDGGVYLSDTSQSGQWSNLTPSLAITQFYKGAVDPTGVNVLLLGGAQDEFTSKYTGQNAWVMVSGGDGGDCAISAADPLNNWLVSSDTGSDDPPGNNEVSMLRTLNGGIDFSAAADDISDALPFSQQFYVHAEKAPYNDSLIIAGTAALWRCNNFFSGTIPSWSVNSPTMLDTNGALMPISAMAFAPSSTSGLIYAFGTGDGQLRITSNGGGGWANPDPARTLPGRYVSGLAFSPTDPNTLYVSYSGFDEDTPGHPGHLFKTANAFAATPTWTDVSPPVNLPNNCVAIDPNFSGSVYVGADIGIWNSGDGGGSWTHYGPADGVPNVAVYDVRFNNSSQVTAFTHGRGAYLLSKINIPILVATVRNIHPIFGCLTCPPDVAFLNPGDEVSLEVPLQGILPVDTIDLQATLLPSADVTPIVGTQDYGVVKGQGSAISRTFKFIAGGSAGGPGAPHPSISSCGSTIQLVFQLTDQGGVDLGQVKIPFRLGIPSHPLIEDFEVLPPPELPPGWFSTVTGAGVPWSTTTNPPPNMPGEGEDDTSGPPQTNNSVFIPDMVGTGQSLLTSIPFPVATSQAQLYFRQAFAVSNTFDGAILEVSIGGGAFQEIVSAGGSFVKDGYNTVLNDRNPLGPRPAWSGDSGGWLPVVVNLPAAAAGQNVQMRWHFAASRGLVDGAWFIDSVFVTEPICLPPVSNPVIINPVLNGSSFNFAINTVSERTYTIEYKTNLTETLWQTLETIPGNGSQQIISVPVDFNSHRFYRFQVQ